MSGDKTKIRWGVLGWARIAREHVIPAMGRAANSVFYAIASRDEAKLAECRTRYNPPVWHRSYEDLLADAAECRRMIDACAANRVKLMEAFMYRYTERTRQVVEAVRSGVLGDIKFVSSTHRFLLANPASIKLKPELGGGAMYDVGCYPLNFAGMIAAEAARQQAGAPSEAVPESVAVQQVRDGGVDMIFSALLKYPTGMIAAIHCGINAQRRICSEIVGTRGLLEIPDTFLDNAGSLTLTLGEERREIPVAQSDRYRLEVEDFAEAILAGRAPQCDLAETLRNMEIMDKLFAAAA